MNIGEISIGVGLLLGLIGAGAFVGHMLFRRRMIPREKHHRGYGLRQRMDI
jgi:UPF0716 family protein affecting phage T7 exclusion